MPRVPESTKTSLRQRLNTHARDQWADLEGIDIRWRANFAYIDAHLTTGEIVPLCRLRYGGSATIWGFALYRASHDDYQDNYLPNGDTAGSPQDALDCAANLYLTPTTTN